MTEYTLRSDGVWVIYEGMSKEDITAMLLDQGKSCVFSTKEDHDLAVQELKKKEPPPDDPNKVKNDYAAEKAKGDASAIAFLAKRMGFE